MIKFCNECGRGSFEDHVCTECGLVFEDHPISSTIPLELNAVQRNKVIRSNVIGGTSRIDLRDCKNKNIRRALRNSQRYLSQRWEPKRDGFITREIKRIVSLLNAGKNLYISSVYRYKKICKQMIFKGYSLEVVAQGIIFLEMKLEGLPYTLYDFKKIGCNKKKIKDYYTKLLKHIDFRIQQPSPKIFINKIIKELGLEERNRTLLSFACVRLIDNIKKLGIQQTNPMVECGACIYVLSLISQKIICEVIGCSDKTLRKKIYEIGDVLHKIDIFILNFGIKHEEFIKDDDYTPIANNVSNFLKIGRLDSKLLINFNYEMKLFGTINRLKAVFNLQV